jgi:hypothetical protein
MSNAVSDDWVDDDNNNAPKKEKEKEKKEDNRAVLLKWSCHQPKDLLPELQVEHVNCLIMGKAGTGKSSFINTCHWVLHPEVFLKQKPAVTRDSESGKHGTVKVQWCQILPAMRFIDTKGLITMEDEQELEAVSLLLEGASVDGKAVEKYYKRVRFWQHIFRTKGEYNWHENIQPPSLQDMPHILLLVVAANDDIPFGLDKVIEIARAQKPPLPIVWLITKRDVANMEDDEVALFRKSLVAQFGSLSNNMDVMLFEIPNYTEESTEMDPDKDKKSLELVRLLLRKGTQFFQEKQRQKEEEINKKNNPKKKWFTWS